LWSHIAGYLWWELIVRDDYVCLWYLYASCSADAAWFEGSRGSVTDLLMPHLINLSASVVALLNLLDKRFFIIFVNSKIFF